MRAAGPRQAERGIALVIVLWVVVLLTVIASSFVYNARGHVQLTGNLAARARAQALADAGVQRGLYEQFKPLSDAERWKAEGRPYEFELGEAKVTVTLVDEAAYIDLNTAQDKLLLGLLTSSGVEEGEAQVLLAAIQDWRDADDLVRPSGAERADYLAAGLKYGPANADFRTLDELKAVLGMTPDLYDRIAGALTVYSHSAGINAPLAPRQVLMALPDVDPAQVDAYLVARQEELEAGLTPTPFPPAAAFPGGGSGVYNARSVATLSDGTVFVRQAVARLTGDPKRPIAFLDWREGQP